MLSLKGRVYPIPDALPPSIPGGSDINPRAVAPIGEIAAGHSNYTRPLGSKQGVSSTTAIPTHQTGQPNATEVILRADALVNFATSIGANQPVASLFNRVRAYEGTTQYAEVEGRALPVSAYYLAYARYMLYRSMRTPGFDKALANNTQAWAHYRTIGLCGKRSNVSIQNVVLQQPFTGTGAVSTYAENDGAGGEFDDVEVALARFFVARSYGSGVSALVLPSCRGFMIAAANDPSAGFTIDGDGGTYTAEEISDIEDRINDYLGFGDMSLTGTAAAQYRGARGQPQDPFTGAGVFLFGDIFPQAKKVTITINTPQAIQVAAHLDSGLAISST